MLVLPSNAGLHRNDSRPGTEVFTTEHAGRLLAGQKSAAVTRLSQRHHIPVMVHRSAPQQYSRNAEHQNRSVPGPKSLRGEEGRAGILSGFLRPPVYRCDATADAMLSILVLASAEEPSYGFGRGDAPECPFIARSRVASWTRLRSSSSGVTVVIKPEPAPSSRCPVEGDFRRH